MKNKYFANNIKDGVVEIPEEILDKAGINKNDLVEFILDDGKIVIRKFERKNYTLDDRTKIFKSCIHSGRLGMRCNLNGYPILDCPCSDYRNKEKGK